MPWENLSSFPQWLLAGTLLPLLVGTQGSPAALLSPKKLCRAQQGQEFSISVPRKTTSVDLDCSPVLRYTRILSTTAKNPLSSSTPQLSASFPLAELIKLSLAEVFSGWTACRPPPPPQSHWCHLLLHTAAPQGTNSVLQRYPLRHLPADDWVWTAAICRHNLQGQIIELPSSTVWIQAQACRISWPKAKAGYVLSRMKAEVCALNSQRWGRIQGLLEIYLSVGQKDEKHHCVVVKWACPTGILSRWVTAQDADYQASDLMLLHSDPHLDQLH